MTQTPLDISPANTPAFTLEFANTSFVAMLSGALYWPEHQTLLAADLHLEKMSSFAKSRQFLPPYDTGATLKRLERDIALSGAKRIIALGDSFHRDEGTTTLKDADLTQLKRMMSTLEWIWIAGNHDPSEHALGGTCCQHVVLEGINLCHEPDALVAPQIAGHLHPAARVKINGRSIRRACFVYDENRLIMPAYGVSTGNLNVLHPAFAPVLNRAEINVAVLGKDRVYPVARRHLVGR